MSRIPVLGASLIALTLGIGAAGAADVPVYAPPAGPVYSPTSAFDWKGAYVGLQGGYNWGTAVTNTGTFSTKGWKGGLYAGYNFMQAGRFVLGTEADVNLNGLKGAGTGGFTYSTPWEGSLRARAGIAFDRFLVYGTGGLAFGSVKAANAVSSDTQFKAGWTLGAGVEAALTDNVVARLEYRYTDLGTAALTTVPASTADMRSHGVMLGLGVKF